MCHVTKKIERPLVRTNGLSLVAICANQVHGYLLTISSTLSATTNFSAYSSSSYVSFLVFGDKITSSLSFLQIFLPFILKMT